MGGRGINSGLANGACQRERKKSFPGSEARSGDSPELGKAPKNQCGGNTVQGRRQGV